MRSPTKIQMRDQDHGEERSGRRPSTRLLGDRGVEEPRPSEHMQALSSHRDGRTDLRRHGVLQQRRTL